MASNGRNIDKIVLLLQKAEISSAVSGKNALIYADSAIVLSQALNKPNYVMAALKIIVQTNLYIGDYDNCIKAANRLMQLAGKSEDSYRMYAYIGIGQANIMKDNYNIAKLSLDSAYSLALKLQNDSALCSVYNGLGLYHTNADANYYKAIEYYLQGIKASERSSNERLHSLLLCNLSGVYYVKRDADGLQYAMECYKRGHKLNQSYLIFIGAVNMSYCYFLKNRYDEAMRYLSEAEQMIKGREFYNQANVYNLAANIHYAQMNYNEAKQYFNKALNESDQTQTSSIAEAYLGLGRIAEAENKYSDALQYLKKGLEISTKRNNAMYRRDLYYEISRCYEKLGDAQSALSAYKHFVNENDSIFNKDKEYALSELIIKYEIEQKENMLKERDITLIKKDARLQLLYGIVIIVIAICFLLYWLNRRKNKRYLQIVRQNLDFVEHEKIMRQTYSELSDADIDEDKVVINNKNNILNEDGKEDGKYTTSALSDEKSSALYIKLHRIMLKRELYKDKSLTKEKLAEELKTNRTYLSQVINTHAGLSFTHYINRLRIEEARRILSNPKDNTPLKAIASDTGFNSLSTFYNAFQSIIGMSPSAYRNKMLEIHNKKRSNTDFDS